MTQWILDKSPQPTDELLEQAKKKYNIDDLVAELLLKRCHNSLSEVEDFINCDITRLRPMADLEAVKTAFSLIKAAIKNNDKLMIYGDYDVDGVTSTVILVKSLRALGLKVDYFIPHRRTHGYGLNRSALEEILKRGYDMVITCDNGITGHDQIDYIKSQGATVLVLDHHEPKTDDNGLQIVPDGDCVVDMKINSVDYPFRELCAGGLCFKFAIELYKYLGREFTLMEELAPFAALATCCDVVPLVDENRILVKYGLEIFNKNVINKGLRELIKVNELSDKKINTYSLGFILGPCINAAGRIEEAAFSANLFLSESRAEISRLANYLLELNKRRKDMTYEGVDRLTRVAESTTDRVLVLFDGVVDESIAGIIAGRIKDRFYKPTLVITKAEVGLKGSGRSINEYNLIAELNRCKEYFTNYGGHTLAAGMSLNEESLEPLRLALNKNCTLTESDLEPKYEISKRIELSDASIKNVSDMELFQPFGQGNRTMLFGTRWLKIKSMRFVGANKSVVQMVVTDGANVMEAVTFDSELIVKALGSRISINEDRTVVRGYENIMVCLVATLKIDSYMGNEKVKLEIKDIKIK